MCVCVLVFDWSVGQEVKAKTALEGKYVKKEAQVTVAMAQKKVGQQSKVCLLPTTPMANTAFI